MKPSMVARNRVSHLIMFGESKTGKSSLAAELLLHGYHLHWVSMDNGHEVIFKLKLSEEQLDKQLDLIILPDTKDHNVAIRTCRAIMSGLPVKICDTHGEKDCSFCVKNSKSFTLVDTSKFTAKDILVFDHLGQLSESAMVAAFKKHKRDLEEKPEWEHYAMQGLLLGGFLGNIQQAKFNVICITHVEETTQEDKTKKLVPMVGTANYSRNVSKFFDHVVYTQIENGKHKFGSMTNFKNSVVTGSRTDVAIEKEEIPSLVKFFQLPDKEVPEIVASIEVPQPREKDAQEVNETSEVLPAPEDDKVPTEKDTLSQGILTPSVVVETKVTEKPGTDRATLLAKLQLLKKK